MEVFMAEFQNGDTANWDAKQVRENQEQRPRPTTAKKRRRRKRRNPILMLLIYVLFVVAASATLAGVGWMLASDMCAFNREEMLDIAVSVTEADNLDTVADKLSDAGLIQYKWFFKLFAKVTNADEKIGAGTFELNTDMDYHALLVGMRGSSKNASADTVTVTIPEGYTVRQIIRLLAEKGVNTEEKLLEAAQTAEFDCEFIDNESQDISRLEGYLFPDTYEFYVGHDPKGALERLLNNFNRKINGDILEQLENTPYDLAQIITIASLIEKETDGGDQAYIASVIYNRLEDTGAHGTYKMLQIDASVLYGLPDHQGAITSADLESDTPYNLYKRPGLPPTPIANPGMKAINAALYPATSDYYFYALGTDKLHHYFSDYSSFTAFVNSSQYGG